MTREKESKNFEFFREIRKRKRKIRGGRDSILISSGMILIHISRAM